MSNTPDAHDCLDTNLKKIAARVNAPGGPAPEVIDRCLELLDHHPRNSNWRLIFMKFRRPILLSSMGMAAVIALVFVLLPHNPPAVHAALIAETLGRQSQGDPLIDVQMENVELDELRLTGHLQLGRSGIAGDVSVQIDDDEGPLTVNAALALSGDGGWVLVRKLAIPDLEAQALLSLFLPPGQETLILLPKDSAMGQELGDEIVEGLSELRSAEVIGAFKEMIARHAEIGATLTEQRDGTILLSLPIEDGEGLEAIFEQIKQKHDADEAGSHVKEGSKAKKGALRKHHAAMAKEIHKKGHHAKSGEPKTDEDDNPLRGATLEVVYDPAKETVRMLRILGLGSATGSITVRLREGDIDPALLDSSRVAKPGVRTLDLAALESMFSGMHGDGKKSK